MEKIKELEIIEIRKDIPKYNIKRGQKGIVAIIDKKEVEVLLIGKETARLVPIPITFAK